jgi:transforming growth factor-beta-induced protein
MKFAKRFTLLSLLLVLGLLLVACGGQEAAPTAESAAEMVEEPTAEPTETPVEEPAQTIVDVAVAAGDFSTLVTAVQAAGLVETLSSAGPFTVFAPTDAAFAALPAGTLEALLADPSGQLTDILLYHVVAGSVMAADVVGLDSAPTVFGEDIAITVMDGSVFLNETVRVTATDIEASNGVIHVIDAVLLPPAEEAALLTIAEIAAGDENFSTLVAALDATGLVETFAGEGEFTVFAPTNDAFTALPEGTLETLLADPGGQLTDILLYHVVEGAVPAETVVTLDSATTLLGEDVTIRVENGNVFLNDIVQVTATDIMASNGIIHVIDGVLLPPAEEAALLTIAEIAAGDENFSTLVTALDAAGLVETLAGEGEYTVFAPTNDAFAALPEGLLDALLADPSGQLTDILLYHVVEGAVPAETVVTLTSAMTLFGEEVTISIVGGTVFLNDVAQVIITDIMASNGIIHVIDSVLVPGA